MRFFAFWIWLKFYLIFFWVSLYKNHEFLPFILFILTRTPTNLLSLVRFQYSQDSFLNLSIFHPSVKLCHHENRFYERSTEIKPIVFTFLFTHRFAYHNGTYYLFHSNRNFLSWIYSGFLTFSTGIFELSHPFLFFYHLLEWIDTTKIKIILLKIWQVNKEIILMHKAALHHGIHKRKHFSS